MQNMSLGHGRRPRTGKPKGSKRRPTFSAPCVGLVNQKQVSR